MLRAVLEPSEDAFGHMLADFLAGEPALGMVERDDGSVFPHATDYYVAPFRSWWPQERRTMRFVRGRVLDVGSGAGRVGLHLEARGHEVVGTDVSPLAVETSRQRGLRDARLGTLDGAVGEDERFDTILLLGNNLGVLGGEREGRRVLKKLARLAGERGRLLAGSHDPYEGRRTSSAAIRSATGRAGGWAESSVCASATTSTRLPGTTCSSPRAKSSASLRRGRAGS